MKPICNLLLVVLILSLVVAAVGCGAKFQLSSLEVSPEVCLAGDTVTVSATLDNTGSAQGDYAVELLVNGAIEQTQTFTLEPQSSQSLSFTLMKSEPSKYVVQLGELTASFTVLEVSNLKVSPSEVRVGEALTVSAELQNVADTQATVHCCLLCQGKEVKAKDITVAGGSREKVTFNLSADTPGIQDVQLGNLSGSFKVLKPAEFEVVSLDIIPDAVKVGEETTITLSIKNVGEVVGTYFATLVVDGAVYETKDVILAGGAMEPVSFSLSKDSAGNYNIEIGGRETILKVYQPVPTGTFLVRTYPSGYAKLIIENRYSDLDVVVVLSSPEEPKIPLLAFYVQAGDSFTVKRWRGGTYLVYCALGQHWNDDSRKFLTDATYYRLEGEYDFLGMKYKFTEWTIRLGPGAPGGQISGDEFPALR